MDSSKDTDLEAVASEAAEAVEVGAVSEAADSVVEERVGNGKIKKSAKPLGKEEKGKEKKSVDFLQ